MESQSNIACINHMQTITESIMTEFGISEDDSYWFWLAVQEALVNAMKHGNKENEQKSLSLVFYSPVDHEVTVEVRDQGGGFTLEAIPDPTSDAGITKLTGRGCMLMEKLMDKVEFHKKDRYFAVCLSKKFESQ